MKNDLKKDIAELFIKEVKDADLFSESELNQLELIISRNELQSKAVVDKFITSIRLVRRDED